MNQKFSAYFNRLSGKKAVVLGVGVSNTPLAALLLEYGCAVTACDKKERSELPAAADRLEALGASLLLGERYLDFPDCDVVYRSPGIRPDIPALSRAQAAGARITSEMEAFFEVCPCPIIGVTGSDGKTTTTSIIAEILRESGYTVHLGGNIGSPLLHRARDMTPGDRAVVELSSFQLMTMSQSPETAVITNISPNHLDVHTSMEEYVDAKRNILARQKNGDRLVLNAGDGISMAFPRLPGVEMLYFGLNKKVESGFYFDGDAIRGTEIGEKIITQKEILLPGLHNIENYMAAFAATRGGVPVSAWRKVAGTFQGVEHRIERVRSVSGVTYYNDSIASSPTRTIAGLRAFDRKVILIAGGYDKNLSYDELGHEILRRVKVLLLTGDTAETIKDSVLAAGGGDGPPIILCRDMREAVLAAESAAVSGDIVMLSPASASFDRYKNFAERGRAFKEIVNGLER